MYRTSWLALSAALGALAPAYAIAQDATPRVEIQLKSSDELGAAGGVFVPFVLSDGTVVFADSWLDYEANGQIGGSIGGGIRQQVGDWVFGANAYLDFLHSANGFNYQQIAAGLEALSDQWEFRINAAAPIGDNSNEIDGLSTARISGGSFVVNQGYEVALYSVNAEVGFKLPVFGADSPNAWKVYAGAFANGSDLTDTVTGLSLRSELTIQIDQPALPGAALAFGGGLRYDSNDELSGSAYIRFSAPLGGSPNTASAKSSPLYQRVERTRSVDIAAGAFGADETGFASTGSSSVVQISAAGGTAANLNAMIAAAGAGAIILASGDIALDSALVLMADQILVGGGGVINLTGANGRSLQYQNPGDRTVLYGGSNGLALMNARMAAPVEPDVLVLANGSTVSTLSIVGGNNAIVAEGVNDITIDNVSISHVEGNGIQLTNVSNVSITNSAISNTFICESSTDCEYSIFNPDYVPHAAINAVGVSDLTISNLDISDVTYGIFIAPDIEEIDWENVAVAPARNIDISNVNITNSRREALLLVGANDVTIDNLHVDNSGLDRDMDLVVFQTSHDITMTNSTLRGGVNGLMFAYYFGIPGENPNNVNITNVDIADTSRAGVFMNPSWNVNFSDVTVTNAGTYGVYFYGDAWGYMGGAVRDITFDGFRVTDAADGAFYLSGPIENINGNIELVGASSTCAADLGAWSGTTITQDAGMAFTINGVVMDDAALATTCDGA